MEILIGFAVAGLVGLTGMGGGVLMAPLLMLVLGLPAVAAVGSSLVFVTVSKLVATPVYMSRGQVNYRLAALQLAGAIPGGFLGTWLLARLSKAHLQPYVLTVVGLTVVSMAVLSLFSTIRKSNLQAQVDSRWLPLLTFPIGLEVGFSSAGAGALGALTLMFTTTMPAAHVIGTDLLFGTALGAVTGGLHLAMGHVQMDLVMKLVAGGVAGSLAGSLMSGYIPPRPLRIALATVLVLLGSQIAWQGLHALWG